MRLQVLKALTKELFAGASAIGKYSISLDVITAASRAADALCLPTDKASLAKFAFRMKPQINCVQREAKTGLVKLVLCAVPRACDISSSARGISPRAREISASISTPAREISPLTCEITLVSCRSSKFCETYGIKAIVNAKACPELAVIRKAEHEIEFPLHLAPVDGFLERENAFMYSFHAEAVDGNVRASRDIPRFNRDEPEIS